MRPKKIGHTPMKVFFPRPTDQNSYTFISIDRLGHSITKSERETDIRDLDAPEIMEIKQVQPSDRFHLKQSEETQGRALKEISMNIGNQT